MNWVTPVPQERSFFLLPRGLYLRRGPWLHELWTEDPFVAHIGRLGMRRRAPEPEQGPGEGREGQALDSGPCLPPAGQLPAAGAAGLSLTEDFLAVGEDVESGVTGVSLFS